MKRKGSIMQFFCTKEKGGRNRNKEIRRDERTEKKRWQKREDKDQVEGERERETDREGKAHCFNFFKKTIHF